MRRLARIAKWVGLVLAVLVGVVVVYFYGLNPKMRPAPNVTASTAPEAIERGRYLAENVMQCVWCHSQVDEGSKPVAGLVAAGHNMALEDKESAELSPQMGIPNLTPDRKVGLGAWSDGEILRAMREGVDNTGGALQRLMPWEHYASIVTDADALAIVSYLRSLKPNDHDPGPFKLPFPYSMMKRSKPRPLDKPLAEIPKEQQAYGDWVLQAAMCDYCHDSFDERHQVTRRLGGGESFSSASEQPYIAPNITQDKGLGIGAYTDQEILRVLNEGVNKAGKQLHVMPWQAYRGMTDADKAALIRGLRAVSPG